MTADRRTAGRRPATTLLVLLLMLAGCAQTSSPSAAPSPSAAGAPPPTETAPTETAATEAPSEAPSPDTASEAPPTQAPAAPTVALADVGVVAEQVATLEAPTAMAIRSGDAALYVAERGGRVLALQPGDDGQLSAGEPLLDISDEVTVDAERGLLGIAFSQDGTTLYVSSTDLEGDTRLDAYPFTGGPVDVAARRTLLQVEQPYPNHNGGNVVTGPDGLLYFGLGDGGSAGDPEANGQNPSTLLGALLRIDPERGDPYAIPDGNPFADGDGGAAEVYAFGLRNPWRFSFDRETDDLWIGDVGQGELEEIDWLPQGEVAGANLGWNLFEGSQPFAGGEDRDGFVFPVFEYPHTDGRCSVTGGYVYRGDAITDLRGAYLFTDFCAGRLQALRLRDGGVADEAVLDVQVEQPVSFGEDADGELYVLSLAGPVYRLVPA